MILQLSCSIPAGWSVIFQCCTSLMNRAVLLCCVQTKQLDSKYLLRFKDVSPLTDIGNYTCVVSNGLGEIRATTQLLVESSSSLYLSVCLSVCLSVSLSLSLSLSLSVSLSMSMSMSCVLSSNICIIHSHGVECAA